MMKSILTILLSFILVVSGSAQTRNVVVGTNGAVVQPTNFWSADVTNARSGLGLGSAATNPASAFQPSSSVLSNITSSNAINLTNVQASNIIGVIPATNIDSLTLSNIGGVLSMSKGGTGATNASGARAALELGSAATNPSTAFQSASSVLTNLASNNGGSLTNITAANIIGTVGLASNITGTAPLATNVTGVVATANGGTGGTNAASARTSLGATTIGANLFTLANPDDTRFIRLNANNSVSALTAADMRAALSVDTNLGTVTSVGMTVPNIFSLSTPTITSSGTFAITLASQFSRQAFIVPNGGGTPAFRALESDDLPSLAITKITGLQTALDGKLSTSGTATLATNVTGVVAVANGGTGGTNAESGRTGLGATTVGSAVFTLANPSAIRFLRYNADNTVSALSDSDFRTAIGLGTASTNPSSAFQPASSSLTNLAANNAVGLTNLQATNLIGLIPASNISTVNLTNISGTLAINSGGTGATNASGARSNLGLDSAATNPASAFQPSSATLSNLANNNGTNITNISVNGVVGALSTNGNAIALTNFPELLLRTNGNGEGLTNLTAANITGTVALASNVTGTIAISNGGSGATAAGGARTNFGLVWTGLTNTNASGFRSALELSATWLTNTNVTNFRTSIGLGVTNDVEFASVALESIYRAGGTNFSIDVDDNALYSATTESVMLDWGGTGVLVYGPLSFSTNSHAAATRTNLGLGSSDNFNIGQVTLQGSGSATNPAIRFPVTQGTNIVYNGFAWAGANSGRLSYTHENSTIFVLDGALFRSFVPFGFEGAGATTNAAITRTNFGLGWPALTNTNAGTGLVSVNTNGEVVSPTNFWQVSPANTRVQVSQPVVNTTNNATNARNLYFYSLAISTTGVTNTVQLPTNSATLLGDVVTVIHEGPTSSVTAIRQTGAGSNLITLNQFQEAVKFIYESAGWRLADNISYVEPIYFSGTNASANAAASRTNLGLGNTNTVAFGGVVVGDITLTTFGIDAGPYGGGQIDFEEMQFFGNTNNDWDFGGNGIYNLGAIAFANTTNAATTRTNLGLGLPALTNTSVTNFQKAIFYTNTAPSNIGGNLGTIAAWIEIVASNGVTYKVPAYTNVP